MSAMPSDHPWQPQDAPRSRLEALEPGSLASGNWKESRPVPCFVGAHGAPPGQAPPPKSFLEGLTHRGTLRNPSHLRLRPSTWAAAPNPGPGPRAPSHTPYG